MGVSQQFLRSQRWLAGQPSTKETPQPTTVALEFLLDVRGTRSFPVPSGKTLRFDSGNKVQPGVPSADALWLIERYPHAFKIAEA